jgi:hypothetical protein
VVDWRTRPKGLLVVLIFRGAEAPRFHPGADWRPAYPTFQMWDVGHPNLLRSLENRRSFASLSDCLELSRMGYGKGWKTVMMFSSFSTTPAAAAG